MTAACPVCGVSTVAPRPLRLDHECPNVSPLQTSLPANEEEAPESSRSGLAALAAAWRTALHKPDVEGDFLAGLIFRLGTLSVLVNGPPVRFRAPQADSTNESFRSWWQRHSRAGQPQSRLGFFGISSPRSALVVAVVLPERRLLHIRQRSGRNRAATGPPAAATRWRRSRTRRHTGAVSGSFEGASRMRSWPNPMC